MIENRHYLQSFVFLGAYLSFSLLDERSFHQMRLGVRGELLTQQLTLGRDRPTHRTSVCLDNKGK